MGKGKYKRKQKHARQGVQQEIPEVRLPDSKVDQAQQKIPSEATDAKGKNKDENSMIPSERTKRYGVTDWLLAIFTFALVLVSIYQFTIMGGQLKVMRVDQRAWLKFEAYSDAPSGAERFNTQITTGQPITYPLRVENIGKTPAKHIVMKIFVDIIDCTHDVPLDHVEGAKVGSPYPFGLIQAGIVFPNQDFKQPVVRPMKGGGPLVATDSEVRTITDGTAYLAIYGIITYDDVFSTPHWTKFCKWIATNGNFRAEKCTNYNSVDDN